MARFEKGNAGRPKGTKNKTTLMGREMLEQYFFQDKGLESLLNDIDNMEYEKDKVNAKIKLLEYILPKQKEVDLNIGGEDGSVLNIVLKQSNTPPITSEDDIKE